MLEIHETPLTQGQVVGDRYHLEAIIGEGGMGVVWAATDTRSEAPHEQRALKFIRRDRTADARNEARLLREAKALSTISHDNVARVFEVSELPDGTPFLVMERLVGETLKQRIARLERLALDDCLRIARGIANGVRAAHAMGIVHRDLKPDNVFIENDGDVKVLDFGIAKELRSGSEGGAGADNSSLTTTGAMLGTLHYMAPEQVFGDTDVDERADVWALGIVIYECLSGKKPTEGSGSGQVLKAIMTKEFARLDAVVAGCPADMADLVEAMLSRERDDRPTMAEVLDQLSIDFTDPAAVSSSREKRISRPSARFRLRGTSAPIVVDPTTTSETFSKSTEQVKHDEEARTPASLRTSRLVWGAVIAVLAFASIVLFLRMRGGPTGGGTTTTAATKEPVNAATPTSTVTASSATPDPTPTPSVTPMMTPTTTTTTAARPFAPPIRPAAARASASSAPSAAPPAAGPPPPAPSTDPKPPASASPPGSRSPPTLSTSRT